MAAPPSYNAQSRRQASDLKSVLAEKIPATIADVKAFRKEHGNTKVGEITVDMVSLKLKIVKRDFEILHQGGK